MRAYSSAQALRYLAFCDTYNLPPLPVSEQLVCLICLNYLAVRPKVQAPLTRLIIKEQAFRELLRNWERGKIDQ